MKRVKFYTISLTIVELMTGTSKTSTSITFFKNVTLRDSK